VGITEKELADCFAPCLRAAARAHKVTKAEIIKMLADKYDGFCFEGRTRLYNPYSLLLFFREYQFDNFWIESGQSKMIADYMKAHKLTVEQFKGLEVSKDFVRYPGNIDSTPPEGYLSQAGYLSLRPFKDSRDSAYILDYPNKEVLNAMSRLLVENIMGGLGQSMRQARLFHAFFARRDYDGIVRQFNELLANIPFDDFTGAAKEAVELQCTGLQPQEWLYRSTILAFLRGLDMLAQGEVHNNQGRADIVIQGNASALVLELKVCYKGEAPDKKLQEALDQVKANDYTNAWPGAAALALVIDDEKRQISRWQSV
jgi:hypothetical protein